MNAEANSVISTIKSDEQQDENTNQYLTFILAGEEYGVDILRVQEIKGWGKVTQIPNVPAYIKGVMNLRGSIVPIIDLRNRFQLESIDYQATNVIIVLRIESESKTRTLGIVVDAVSDTYDISDDNVKLPPDIGDGNTIEILKGMATVDDKMIMLLDIDQLLSNTEIDSLDITPEEEEPEL